MSPGCDSYSGYYPSKVWSQLGPSAQLCQVQELSADSISLYSDGEMNQSGGHSRSEPLHSGCHESADGTWQAPHLVPSRQAAFPADRFSFAQSGFSINWNS